MGRLKRWRRTRRRLLFLRSSPLRICICGSGCKMRARPLKRRRRRVSGGRIRRRGAAPCSDTSPGESLTYRFAEATGPVYARSRNEVSPADSFVKSLTSTGPSKLSADGRAQLLTALAVSTPPAPVEAVTLEEFQRAAADLTDPIGRQAIEWFLARTRDGQYALPPYGKGVRVAVWKPGGYSGWKELSGGALQQMAQGLFQGASVTVEGYAVEHWDETGRLLTSFVLSGVRDGEIATGGSGTVVIQLAQTPTGDWQWLHLGTDDGDLAQSLTGGTWKPF